MKLRASVLVFSTLIVTLPYAVLVACSGNSNHPAVLGDPPPTGDGGGKVKDTGLPQGDAGPCEPLQLKGYVTETSMMGSAPTPTGGTIVEGFYILTQAREYGTGAGNTFQQSLLVKPGEMHFTNQDKGSTTIVNTPFTYVVDMPETGTPTSITLTAINCEDGSVAEGGSATAQLGYSATATTITLTRVGAMGTIVDIFTKQ